MTMMMLVVVVVMVPFLLIGFLFLRITAAY